MFSSPSVEQKKEERAERKGTMEMEEKVMVIIQVRKEEREEKRTEGNKMDTGRRRVNKERWMTIRDSRMEKQTSMMDSSMMISNRMENSGMTVNRTMVNGVMAARTYHQKMMTKMHISSFTFHFIFVVFLHFTNKSAN